MRSTRSSLLAAAALAMAGAGMVGGVAQADARSTIDEARGNQARGSTAGAKTAQQLRQAELRDTAALAIFGRGGWDLPRYPRPGWSVRQGRRMALKRRNQRRHRKACRG